MLFDWINKEPPLHKAVLTDNYDEIKALSHNEEAQSTKNYLGFTALELVKYLGKNKAIAILDPNAFKKTFLVQLKGNQKTLECNIESFERIFNIRYLSHYRFANYDVLKEVIRNCPWILKGSFLGKENRQLGETYQKETDAGYIAKVSINWINKKIGFGLFANEDLAIDTYIGEYTGLVRNLHRLHSDHNAYCFHYPTWLWSWKYFMIDAMHEGNEMRFVNHSDFPNLEPMCLVNRNLLHLAFRTNAPIPKGTQLTLNYGPDYWKKREKVKE
jgi:uncharacterized protein